MLLLVLALQGRGFRACSETLVITLIMTIGACFAYEIFFARPLWIEAARGFIPTFQILKDREMLYLAIGILGATVMPHNLYLHSSIVQTRAFALNAVGNAKRSALPRSILTLALGIFRSSSTRRFWCLARPRFHGHGLNDVADIGQAYKLLHACARRESLRSVLLRRCAAMFRAEFHACGTLAGQIVMEGFLHWRVQPWLRRLITQSMAIIPAAHRDRRDGRRARDVALILSQVILSFQLPMLEVVPLEFQLPGDKSKMGRFTNSPFTAACRLVHGRGHHRHQRRAPLASRLTERLQVGQALSLSSWRLVAQQKPGALKACPSVGFCA